MNKRKISKKRWSEVLESVSKMPPPVIETTKQCFHETLTKIIADDTMYYCDSCKGIFELYASKAFTAKQFVAMTQYTMNYIAERDKASAGVIYDIFKRLADEAKE